MASASTSATRSASSVTAPTAARSLPPTRTAASASGRRTRSCARPHSEFSNPSQRSFQPLHCTALHCTALHRGACSPSTHHTMAARCCAPEHCAAVQADHLRARSARVEEPRDPAPGLWSAPRATPRAQRTKPGCGGSADVSTECAAVCMCWWWVVPIGNLNKLVLEFPSPFWCDEDMFGCVRERVDIRGRLYMFWNLARVHGAPILVCLLSGDSAHEAERLDDRALLVDEAMALLRRTFGSHVPDPTRSLLTAWGQDPLARGSYSFVAVGATEQGRPTRQHYSSGGGAWRWPRSTPPLSRVALSPCVCVCVCVRVLRSVRQTTSTCLCPSPTGCSSLGRRQTAITRPQCTERSSAAAGQPASCRTPGTRQRRRTAQAGVAQCAAESRPDRGRLSPCAPLCSPLPALDPSAGLTSDAEYARLDGQPRPQRRHGPDSLSSPHRPRTTTRRAAAAAAAKRSGVGEEVCPRPPEQRRMPLQPPAALTHCPSARLCSVRCGCLLVGARSAVAVRRMARQAAQARTAATRLRAEPAAASPGYAAPPSHSRRRWSPSAPTRTQSCVSPPSSVLCRLPSALAPCAPQTRTTPRIRTARTLRRSVRRWSAARSHRTECAVRRVLCSSLAPSVRCSVHSSSGGWMRR